MPEDKSIIKVIQDMVAAGEPEEKIIATLNELGIETEKAKKLLLIGQSDVFALLKNEIHSIVLSDLEKEKPEIDSIIEQRVLKVSEELGKKEALRIKEEILEWEKELATKSYKFQKQQQETLLAVKDLNDRTRTALNELGDRVSKVELDLKEAKIGGIGQRNTLISYAILAFGALFVLIAFGLMSFFLVINQLNPQTIIITVVMGILGVALIYISGIF